MSGAREPAISRDRYAAVGALEAGSSDVSDSEDDVASSRQSRRLLQNVGLVLFGVCIGVVGTHSLASSPLPAGKQEQPAIARSAEYHPSWRAADHPLHEEDTGVADDEGIEEYDEYGEGPTAWFDEEDEGEDEGVNETEHEHEANEQDRITLKELALPACLCNGRAGKKDAYRNGASSDSEILCMGPWGDPGGYQYCYPAHGGKCPVTMHRCNNTLAEPKHSNETVKADMLGPSAEEVAKDGPCLCAFDIDRTLTAKQQNRQWRGRSCENTSMVSRAFDSAFGGGSLTLSALSTLGINETACGACYVGVVSHGTARGTTDLNRRTIINALMTPSFAEVVKNNSDATRWSIGSNGWSVYRFGYGSGRIHSPFVVKHGDTKKQWGVEGILEWYASKGIQIPRNRVWFFDDRADNVLFFNGTGMNSRQISCGSRDFGGASKVGYCGARPEEIQLLPGNIACDHGAAAGGHAPAGHNNYHPRGHHR
eukprot:TRINITY_DN12817_c0_g1_i1.p1 TRINITY_DN12817_c0_g1~~TRINITY_DN12817_c0_g1_i1.p1  ORF type:complete len:482 (+),score=116.59 TRINITY_DN12817_c0_g1_i1:205-1650(+)